MEVDIMIKVILDRLNIKKYIKGYKYWVTGVKIFLENEEITMLALYELIAKKHRTTASKVEKALRYSYAENKKLIQEHFNIKYKINNTCLLTLLKESVKEEVKFLVKQEILSNAM